MSWAANAGVIVNHLDQALINAGAAFDVTLRPVLVDAGDGELAVVPGRRVVMLGSTPLDVVGTRWEPFQNRDVLGYAASLASVLGSEVTHCGMSGGLSRFWCRIEMLEFADGIGAGVYVTSAHTGSGGLCITLYAEADGSLARLGAGKSWSHGATLEQRLGDPVELAAWLNRLRIDQQRVVTQLRERPVDAEEFVAAWDHLAPGAKATTARRESHRREVLDALAGRWVRLGERTAWTTLVAGCWWLDAQRPAPHSERVELTLDEGGWVVRAKQKALDSLR